MAISCIASSCQEFEQTNRAMANKAVVVDGHSVVTSRVQYAVLYVSRAITYRAHCHVDGPSECADFESKKREEKKRGGEIDKTNIYRRKLINILSPAGSYPICRKNERLGDQSRAQTYTLYPSKHCHTYLLNSLLVPWRTTPPCLMLYTWTMSAFPFLISFPDTWPYDRWEQQDVATNDNI